MKFNARKEIAFFNNRWCPLEEVTIAIDDHGFYQSATAVERLRTWESQIVLLPHHLKRFEKTCHELRIQGIPTADRLREIISTICEQERNDDASAGDIGITMFATPGRRHGAGPTFCIHPTELDQQRLNSLSNNGQPLVITDVQQPPDACWPRSIKVRSRLHYYLADLAADDKLEGALGVLLDQDGSITETSTSNIFLREGNTLIAPPADRVLPGIMAHIVTEIIPELGMQLVRRPVSTTELREGEEVWLTGSEVGLFYASSVDDQTKNPSDLYRQLGERLRKRLSQQLTL